MISKSVFLQEIEKLELNFGVQLSEDRLMFFFYRIGTYTEFTDETLIDAVEKILNSERFFPTFSVFLEYAPRKRELVL